MAPSGNGDPSLGELVRLKELRADPDIARIFPGEQSLVWEIRQHRAEYVIAGALFEVAGRLLAHPATFKRIALAIGARRLADRIDPNRND
jgi:hypothetical protein